jgi:hypothetical protein
VLSRFNRKVAWSQCPPLLRDEHWVRYGIRKFVSISCGGLADWGFGVLRDRQVPINAIFSVFASLAVLSVILVLLIKPHTTQDQPP